MNLPSKKKWEKVYVSLRKLYVHKTYNVYKKDLFQMNYW